LDPYGDKIFVAIPHTSDQLPAYLDADGNLVLYTEGADKAVLSVTLLDSVGGLKVNGVDLPITQPQSPRNKKAVVSTYQANRSGLSGLGMLSFFGRRNRK
jgi:hypothetical protein